MINDYYLLQYGCTLLCIVNIKNTYDNIISIHSLSKRANNLITRLFVNHNVCRVCLVCLWVNCERLLDKNTSVAGGKRWRS